ncbi:MAG TPA: hypothetical protein VEB66_15085 [Opitutaceae bacterium]|nr:hypothetical protein [Opitutaceae bacterium]
MSALVSLWLPILLSAVVVFVISSLVHMVFKWHAADYGRFENEEAIRVAIRGAHPAPGRYVIPFCGGMKDMASEAMKQKYAEGPVGHVTMLPNGQPNMGKYLGMWFLLSVLVSAVAAFLAVKAYGLGAPALGAAKMAGAVAFVGYGFGTLQESVWMGRPWSATIKYLIDAALYAVGTAAVFYFLWR